MDNEIRMPFTNEKPEDLIGALEFINKCGMPLEAFDCFLSEYSDKKDIGASISFAIHEWDL